MAGMARDFNGMAGDTNGKPRHISSIFFNIQVPLCVIMAHVAQFFLWCSHVDLQQFMRIR